MTPRPETTEPIATDEGEVETPDAVAVDESPLPTWSPPPCKKMGNDGNNDEVVSKEQEKEEEEEEKTEVEDTPVKEAEEEEKPKTPEEIRNAFDPFGSSSNNNKAGDKIAKESADATKELASLVS